MKIPTFASVQAEIAAAVPIRVVKAKKASVFRRIFRAIFGGAKRVVRFTATLMTRVAKAVFSAARRISARIMSAARYVAGKTTAAIKYIGNIGAITEQVLTFPIAPFSPPPAFMTAGAPLSSGLAVR